MPGFQYLWFRSCKHGVYLVDRGFLRSGIQLLTWRYNGDLCTMSAHHSFETESVHWLKHKTKFLTKRLHHTTKLHKVSTVYSVLQFSKSAEKILALASDSVITTQQHMFDIKGLHTMSKNCGVSHSDSHAIVWFKHILSRRKGLGVALSTA